MGIIKSILDTDTYKLTMQQIVLHQFPDTEVVYKFKCRNKADFTYCLDDIRQELDALEHVKLTEEEAAYLRTIRFLKSDYIEYLSMFRFLPTKHIHIAIDEHGNLDLTIKGPWLSTILYEVPVLAIINECYFKRELNRYNRNTDVVNGNIIYPVGLKNLEEKIKLVKNYADEGFKFADFGTRRRFSADWQELVVAKLIKDLPNNFVGTSNVDLARRYKVTPIGTMAHEYIQCHQAMDYKLINSQKTAFENWAQEYRGDLGIALSDTINMKAFLRDFDLYFSKLYDGARHDSGDPYDWCEQLINHYKKLKIDPKTKTAVFSDGLTFPKALELYKRFKDEIKISFGIGTNLTNDVGHEPLQIVIKVIECNGSPVAKLSDNIEKQMCEDQRYISFLKKVFGVE